jgi:hypothetical protein
VKLGHLVGFIIKKFVTMHGHMNVKKAVLNLVQAIDLVQAIILVQAIDLGLSWIKKRAFAFFKAENHFAHAWNGITADNGPLNYIYL